MVKIVMKIVTWFKSLFCTSHYYEARFRPVPINGNENVPFMKFDGYYCSHCGKKR